MDSPTVGQIDVFVARVKAGQTGLRVSAQKGLLLGRAVSVHVFWVLLETVVHDRIVEGKAGVVR